MRTKSGFTLVEILIVVVILGILAAIVIPQFTGASTEAKESSLMSNLQAVRAQIELFKIQHNDILPGEILNATTGALTAVAAEADVVNALTSKTNQYGVVDTSGGTDVTFRFGPYMQKLPDNPFSTSTASTVPIKSENASSLAIGATKLAAGGSTSGWYLVTSGVDKGFFQAADPLSNTVTSVAHIDY